MLPEALIPFIEKRLESALTGHWQVGTAERVNGFKLDAIGNIVWVQVTLPITMERFWMEAFKIVLGQVKHSVVNEFIAVRNKLAHIGPFTYDDAERALDSMRRLLKVIGAEEAVNLWCLARADIRMKFLILSR